MSTLTSDGQRLVRDLARTHGFGADAVEHLLDAMIAGRGRMAQFSHPELGGSGQWMAGGMLMIGSMFDNALKARVGALCNDLARAVDSDATLRSPEEPRSGSAGVWWPDGLGSPSASGAQDSMRYAYFAEARRLALEIDGEVRVHDTLDHRIGGFAQQQGGTAGISLSSQHGVVDLASLPLVSDDGAKPRVSPMIEDAPAAKDAPAAADIAAARPVRAAGSAPAPASAGESADDPLSLIERLARLRDQGVLSEAEFAAKKGELLARL